MFKWRQFTHLRKALKKHIANFLISCECRCNWKVKWKRRNWNWVLTVWIKIRSGRAGVSETFPSHPLPAARYTSPLSVSFVVACIYKDVFNFFLRRPAVLISRALSAFLSARFTFINCSLVIKRTQLKFARLICYFLKSTPRHGKSILDYVFESVLGWRWKI